MQQTTSHTRIAVRLQGVVQGVGLRPFVLREAQALGLTGWVRNGPHGVEIEAQGPPAALEALLARLTSAHPPTARVRSLQHVPCALGAEPDFAIAASADAPAAAQPTPSTRHVLPADLASCAACLAEVHDPADRRHRYPFAACTQCGPRYAILDTLPYDRAATTMRAFPLCPACAREYDDPSDRRCHAQATACPACGPKLALRILDSGEPRHDDERPTAYSGESALALAVKMLREDRIVAVKGLGGFALLVDACSPRAVHRLRQRKSRGRKPLACMAVDIDEIGRWCDVDDEAARLLRSAAAPIVLLPLRADLPSANAALADAVAPGIASVGFMLAPTPLHDMLARDFGGPLVCTSGNRRGEPICIDDNEAAERLAGIADALLTHDRDVVRPLDDSVVRRAQSVTIMLRRARGYVPEPIALPVPVPATLALGGHDKSTICVVQGTEAFISQHLGGLDDPLSIDLLRHTVDEALGLLDVTPTRVACDLHPDHASSALARALATTWDVPLIPVAHHHAHLVSCVADALQPAAERFAWIAAANGGARTDPDPLAQTRMGLAWDGVGLGSDGTLWGGEALRFSSAGFTRVATLRPIALVGGDAAARDPRRVAFALCWEALGAEAADKLAAAWFAPHERRVLGQMLTQGVRCVPTSGIGRLFDGIAALAGACAQPQTHEGEAPMRLEALLPAHVAPACTGGYPWTMGPDGVLDWAPLVAAVVDDRRRGCDPAVISLRFHQAVAAAAMLQVSAGPLPEVALSGGCWNNAWLVRAVTAGLEAEGHRVLRHRDLPCGDGGLSLGQALVAATGFRP